MNLLKRFFLFASAELKPAAARGDELRARFLAFGAALVAVYTGTSLTCYAIGMRGAASLQDLFLIRGIVNLQGWFGPIPGIIAMFLLLTGSTAALVRNASLKSFLARVFESFVAGFLIAILLGTFGNLEGGEFGYQIGQRISQTMSAPVASLLCGVTALLALWLVLEGNFRDFSRIQAIDGPVRFAPGAGGAVLPGAGGAVLPGAGGAILPGTAAGESVANAESGRGDRAMLETLTNSMRVEVAPADVRSKPEPGGSAEDLMKEPAPTAVALPKAPEPARPDWYQSVQIADLDDPPVRLLPKKNAPTPEEPRPSRDSVRRRGVDLQQIPIEESGEEHSKLVYDDPASYTARPQSRPGLHGHVDTIAPADPSDPSSDASSNPSLGNQAGGNEKNISKDFGATPSAAKSVENLSQVAPVADFVEVEPIPSNVNVVQADLPELRRNLAAEHDVDQTVVQYAEQSSDRGIDVHEHLQVELNKTDAHEPIASGNGPIGLVPFDAPVYERSVGDALVETSGGLRSLADVDAEAVRNEREVTAAEGCEVEALGKSEAGSIVNKGGVIERDSIEDGAPGGAERKNAGRERGDVSSGGIASDEVGENWADIKVAIAGEPASLTKETAVGGPAVADAGAKDRSIIHEEAVVPGFENEPMDWNLPRTIGAAPAEPAPVVEIETTIPVRAEQPAAIESVEQVNSAAVTDAPSKPVAKKSSRESTKPVRVVVETIEVNRAIPTAPELPETTIQRESKLVVDGPGVLEEIERALSNEGEAELGVARPGDVTKKKGRGRPRKNASESAAGAEKDGERSARTEVKPSEAAVSPNPITDSFEDGGIEAGGSTADVSMTTDSNAGNFSSLPPGSPAAEMVPAEPVHGGVSLPDAGEKETEASPPAPENPAPESDLADRAARLVITERRASISFLQRKLGVTLGEAQHVMAALEASGVVGPYRGNPSRDILQTLAEYEER